MCFVVNFYHVNVTEWMCESFVLRLFFLVKSVESAMCIFHHRVRNIVFIFIFLLS